jgi:hypothetical protein
MPLMMAVQAVRKNVARQIAVMSGGEYAPFTTERGFEARVQEVAKHARNRYLLSFRPTDNTPGLHVLDVRLTRDLGARVVARTSYWALEKQPFQRFFPRQLSASKSAVAGGMRKTKEETGDANEQGSEVAGE